MTRSSACMGPGTTTSTTSTSTCRCAEWSRWSASPGRETSLAVGTLYAEGMQRFLESLSTCSRLRLARSNVRTWTASSGFWSPPSSSGMVRSAPLTTPAVDSVTGTLYALAIRANETMLRVSSSWSIDVTARIWFGW
jgi:hypothetical protein